MCSSPAQECGEFVALPAVSVVAPLHKGTDVEAVLGLIQAFVCGLGQFRAQWLS